ncbi:torus domain-containing protein [Elsinoe australis]|uniref:Torus domain-containing protein n=1 Tax=Elsinoe australis TaxID=40998 RepID=A0A4U7ATP7_9PEZI|nr:torus domain-containing protein [Elsinoe australis]
MNFGQQLPQIHTDGHFKKRTSGDFSSPQMGPGEMPPNGALNGHMPMVIPGQGRGMQQQYGAGFAAARSPPKQKSTSHVPCKFFPIGQCQAGAACQFSHDLDPMTQNAPCKYFARGSCKFGQGCALMHMLPDGRVVNRPTRGGHGFNRRGPPNGHMYAGNSSSPVAINTQDPGAMPLDPMAFQNQDPGSAYTHQPNSPIFKAEMYPPEGSPPFGSPPRDFLNPLRSPPRPGLSARDAQLPSSWDSQGVSQAARNGPYAASVPGRFGLESPPSSYPNKAQLGNTALRDRDSAFGDTANLDGMLHGLGSSPRENEPLTFSKRPLHSERFARSRPFISSSLDVRNTQFLGELSNSDPDGGDSDDGAGEDLLPSSLHDLLPTDKLRRASRSGPPEDESNPHWTSAPRRIISNGGNAESKTGSLSPHSASPSRYSAMWAARSSGKPDSEVNSVSAFGHVGSPLRPSNLRTSSTTATSPPNASDTNLSMLTSQLQRAKLNNGASGSPTAGGLHPTSSPASNVLSSRGTASSNSRQAQGLGAGERSLSGNFSNTLGRERIEEESIFSMEEETGGLEGSEAEPSPHHENASAGNAWGMGRPSAVGVGVIGSPRGK